MSETLGIIFIVAVVLFVIGAATYDRVCRHRVARLLASREPLDSRTFALTFFGDSPAKVEVAVALREVLSKNLKQQLDGLRPDDRLDEDLHAELPANPHLFWDIEREIGVATPVTDWDAYQRCLANIHTFRDLVDYVASRQSGTTGAA